MTPDDDLSPELDNSSPDPDSTSPEPASSSPEPASSSPEPGSSPELDSFGVEAEDLDGHTLDELTDYLDAGRTPRDPSIEESPGCQLVLQSMERLRTLTSELFESEAESEPQAQDSWMQQLLARIAVESRPGRRIPLTHPDPVADLAISEGAVRGVVRAAESDVTGVLVGRCRLEGDVDRPGAPVVIQIEASVGYGVPLLVATERLRAAVLDRLALHTDLVVSAVDIIVQDLHAPSAINGPHHAGGRGEREPREEI